ncbi:radical SAM protein [Pseudomonas gingeri]|uniref:radical SAM protein n=1 Tax=Pseudomonas gingeri TaxID=117681 RepID=UPI0015A43F25|nr:radical SAM protein [Pseudomonas gingeri]NWD07575.1 biotin synthase [Pseudomonas gingeri]NWE35558.1 biotin synthase [Pseudomonas gingeri]NWE54887.1 biotin synthase [Pseudomonas gingeri]NWF01788.1 biotin synthase [Pseudomonas gingeri]
MLTDTVNLKLEVLCNGVNFTDDFLKYYKEQTESIEKRWAYGTGDSVILNSSARTPQEIVLDGQIIAAANYNPTSTIFIDLENGTPVLKNQNNFVKITFPRRPIAYGKYLSSGELFEQYVTVYGNSTLGIFSPGHCYYFKNDRECKFCSLGSARMNLSDHKIRIKPDQAGEAVSLAIREESGRYKRVLFNGGTTPNYDRGYSRHMDLMARVKNTNQNTDLEYHLISMLPKDFRLFDRFKSLGDNMSMSLEVFNSKLFSEVCPGKSKDYTRERFFAAFEAAVETLGRGNVYVGFVAGMEPLESIIEGIEYFGNMGVVPAVAVFHPDAGSQYSKKPRPSLDFLRSLGKKMSEIYQREGFRPLIEGSGRNSLDTEAYLGGFS